jgi:uncharacterized membrane protein YjdF
MSYVASTLGQHERVLFRTGYHWLVWVGCALLVIPALGLAAGAYPFSALDVTLLVLSLIPAPVGVYYFARAPE